MFYYLNLNPRGKRTGDCVIRATALALGVEWECASDLLYERARNCCCEMSCVGCYSKLFESLGFQKIDVSGTDMTVEQVANLYRDKTALIRINGHLTCSLPGAKIHDIWDCSQEKADCIWIAE